LGERWTDGNPTSTDNLDVARIKNDANRWTLQQILADPDNPEAGPIQTMPSGVYSGTDEDGDKIIAVDLDNPFFMWDLRKFRQLSRNTSWHAELGHMPTRMLIWIPADGASVEIYDRSTMVSWLTFTAAAGNWIGAASVTDIQFKDGCLYIANPSDGPRLGRANFVEDLLEGWTTVGYRTHGNISGRNDASGWNAYWVSGAAIVNNGVNAVAAIRDPLGAVDIRTGRPLHRVAVGTAGGGSVSDAGIATFYDSGSTNPWIAFMLSPSGVSLSVQSGGTKDYVDLITSIQSIATDGFGIDVEFDNGQAGGRDLPWTNSAVVSGVGLVSGGSVVSEGSDFGVFASDEGLVIAHMNHADGTDSLLFAVNAVANWPPYSGVNVECYAMEDATGLFGNDLVASGAGVTYTGGKIGSAANFDGTDTLELTNAVFTPSTTIGSDFYMTVQFWLKSTSEGNGDFILGLTESSSQPGNDWFTIFEDTSPHAGGINVRMTDNANTQADTVGTQDAQDLHDGVWHHVCVTVDLVELKLFVDGDLIDTYTLAHTTGTIPAWDTLCVGDLYAGFNSQWTGAIDDLSLFYGKALTQPEIRALVDRGHRASNSTVNSNDALDASDIDYVAVDPDGNFFAAGNQTAVVIFDHYGIPVLEDASPGGNIQDVDVWSTPGADDPSYAMATTTDIEVVQQSPTLSERA